MEKMLQYVFEELQDSKYMTSAILKELKHQRTVNRRMVYALLALTGYGFMLSRHCMEQQTKIEKLRKEIEELQEQEVK